MKPAPASITRIAILGAGGRMGQTLMHTAQDMPDLRITAAVVSPQSPLLGQQADGITFSSGLEQALADSDVMVDFSTPSATLAAIDACVAACKPIVIGVTGLNANLRKQIALAGRSIPILLAPNMSLGAALLMQLAHIAAGALAVEFTVDIRDRHHKHKKDAPSGTALALGDAVASARGVTLDDHAVYMQSEDGTVANPGDIRFASLREGEIIGDHSVTFTSGFEQLALCHHAKNRAVFAQGALVAARWIVGKQAGEYGMADVLELRSAGT